MEKPQKKLLLNQETIRHLTNPDELNPLAPGFGQTVGTKCTNTCASACFGTCPALVP